MPNHLINMPVTVEIISPVHVGSGDPVQNKWLSWAGGRVSLLDEEKLLGEIVARELEPAFEVFCLDPHQRQPDEFLRQHNIPLRAVTAYELPCPREPNRLLPFIKTGGRPYLPGSSLKGALRSSLLRAFVLAGEQNHRAAQDELQTAVGRRTPSPGQRLETLLYTGTQEGRAPAPGQRPNYDLLRALGLSDSDPLALTDLQVRPVKIISTRPQNRMEAKPFTIYPELLKPGVTLRVRAWFDRSLFEPDHLGLKQRQPWAQDFAGHCRASAQNLLTQEQTFYDRHNETDLAAWCRARLDQLAQCGPHACLLPIGWGTGYDAKTVTDLFERDLFEAALETYKNTHGLGRPQNKRQNRWLGPPLSPKSRRVTTWQRKKVPLGWVKLTILED